MYFANCQQTSNAYCSDKIEVLSRRCSCTQSDVLDLQNAEKNLQMMRKRREFIISILIYRSLAWLIHPLILITIRREIDLELLFPLCDTLQRCHKGQCYNKWKQIEILWDNVKGLPRLQWALLAVLLDDAEAEREENKDDRECKCTWSEKIKTHPLCWTIDWCIQRIIMHLSHRKMNQVS